MSAPALERRVIAERIIYNELVKVAYSADRQIQEIARPGGQIDFHRSADRWWARTVAHSDATGLSDEEAGRIISWNARVAAERQAGAAKQSAVDEAERAKRVAQGGAAASPRPDPADDREGAWPG